MQKFLAGHARPGECDNEVVWVACGDCQEWHIGCWQEAIRKRYGESAASELKKGDDGVWYFEYDNEVFLYLIREDLGVRNSGPSVSSSSVVEKPHHVSKKWWKKFDRQRHR